MMIMTAQTIPLLEGTLTVYRGRDRTSFTFTAAAGYTLLDRCFYDPGPGGKADWAVAAIVATIEEAFKQ